MKYILLMLTFFMFGFAGKVDRPAYFEFRLNDIGRKLSQVITNEDECEKLKSQALILSYNIDDAIKNESEYTPDEKNQLNNLKKEAEGMADYIGEVSVINTNSSLGLEKFKLANARVGGQISSVVKEKFCMDIISVTIGKYVAYIAINNYPKTYTIKYKWKTPNGMHYGQGEMAIGKNCLRAILSNNNNNQLNKIIILNFNCKEL